MSSPSGRNPYLDLVRGVSALCVFAGHLRAALFEDFASTESSGSLVKCFYLSTGLGHQAVMIFFVLSGFFVGGSVLSKRDNFSTADYTASRCTRLWVVLIPALFFTLFIDTAIKSFCPELRHGDYFSRLNSGPYDEYSNSLVTFLSNICFLQTVAFPIYGSNSPLWSLANEFWYYVAFPAILFGVGYLPSKRFRRAAAIAVAMVVILPIFLLTSGMLEGFFIWCLGVGAFRVSFWFEVVGKKKLILFSIGAITFLTIAVVDSKLEILPLYDWISSDIVIGLAFSSLCCLLPAIWRQFGYPKKILRITESISEHSYTLYLFHFPLVLLVFSLFYRERELTLTPLSLAEFASWSVVIYGICFLAWYAFERNTTVVRTLLRRASRRI